MKCPNCGGELRDAEGRCLRCKATSSTLSQVTTGALPSLADDSETVFSAPPIGGTGRGLSSGADGATVFAHSAGPDEDAATVFALPPSTGEESTETRFVPPPSRVSGHNPDTTGLPASAGGRPAKARGPLEVGQRFGARYIIIKQLGVGGMGAVYQAWDGELGVAVALKVIRPEVTRDPVSAQDIERRFKQELLLARQVTHKNVVRIHDLGEIDGIKYITMPYIEGQDLASVLRNERLTVPKVVALARQIAAGLQAAHEAGVVHRDLKPANVMMEGDHAIIMDFGIARSTSRGGAAPAPARPSAVGSRPGATGTAVLDVGADAEMTRIAETVVGEVIGTIEYMAPEQARGEHVDQRADVYAFGLIIYDLLSGKRRSEHAVSAVGELQKRLAQPPPSIRTVLPDIPLPLDQLITKCTEPDAAKRYQTTAELVAAIELLDDNGKLRPIKRSIRLPYAIGAAVVLLALSGYIWWAMRPEATHDPISVLIADFVNSTGDPAFDSALTQTVQRALQDASFISAYDRSRVSALGVSAPGKLDEPTARQIAVKQGLGVVVSGSIESRRSGYRISVKAIQTVTGDEITSRSGDADSKDQVLETATRLMARVRRALGDDTSESAQLFAMRSVSTSSMEVVRLYAEGVEAQARGDYEKARESLRKSVELDPKFALGYHGLAAMSQNLFLTDDAQKYMKEAIRYSDGLTEHEKFTTRGLYFRMMSDDQQCVREYGELLVRYPADVAARNQRAICLKNLRKLREALDELREASRVLPNHVGFRTNIALYSNFAGDFEGAARELNSIERPSRPALLALAHSQVARGLLQEATATYEKLTTTDARGKSLATSGLGDVLIYQGRFAEAIRTLQQGAAADLAAKNPDRAAIKFATIGYAHVLAGHKAPAIEAAEKALMLSTQVHTRFPAARVLIEAGAPDRAHALVQQLASSSDVWGGTPAHAKIIEGEIALQKGDAELAIKLLSEANETLDTWLGHFALGRAYLAANSFVKADAEFDRCLTRRGEALSLMDEDPSYGYFPLVYYQQGRVREAIGTAGFADAYREYLKIRGSSTEDPLVPQIRKRLGN